MIEWKRARRDETDLAHRRIWQSRCGRYEVVESVGKFTDMGTMYYAILLPCTIISRHRFRNPAENACERHANPPKPRKRRKKK